MPSSSISLTTDSCNMCHLALPKEQSVPLREQPIEIIAFVSNLQKNYYG
jgi:hypothetical protein